MKVFVKALILAAIVIGHSNPAAAEKVTESPKYAKSGFVTLMEDGRLWVFKSDAPELVAFRKDGDLAKHVVRPGAGPDGLTIKAPDSETIMEYVATKPGFVTKLEDGRLWVFKEGAAELKDFLSNGELAKHVVRPSSGPMGMTVKAPDQETIASYLAK